MKHAASSNIESVLAKADPALARAIEAVIARQGPVKLAPSHTPPFEALVRAVVYRFGARGRLSKLVGQRCGRDSHETQASDRQYNHAREHPCDVAGFNS